MNADDKLAAIIAEHPWYVSPTDRQRGYCLGCLGKPIPVGGTATWAEFATFAEYATHLAAAITATDSLAVIERDRLHAREDAVAEASYRTGQLDAQEAQP